MIEPIRIGRQQIELILHQPGDDRLLALAPLAEQNPLERVELLEIPRLEVIAQVVFQQPVIENCFSFLLARYGRIAVLKNSGSFLYRKKCSSWLAYLR